jgi:DNA repair protein RecN (Recombination protein N)
MRSRAARALEAQVCEGLHGLAMAQGRFQVELISSDPPQAHGLESVEFRVSAHPGLPLGPLAQVASGGELSRIGLAIQVAASQISEVPTLIFDEVDVGIGGGVAEIVGRMLHRLGRHRQVLCVTHLPQVAARGDQHLSVVKREENASVLSRVQRLTAKQRVEELARMLGGIEITATTRKHAAELLKP